MSEDMRSLGDILGRTPPPRGQGRDDGLPIADVAWTKPGESAEVSVPLDHDPTGLDLASRIAEAVSASSVVNMPTQPRRKRRSDTPARARKNDPVPLGAAVGNLVAARGWTRGINLKALLADWAGLVGTANADHSTPEAYADQVLTLRADSTAWASSLRLLAPRLVARLNDALGQGTVTRIEVLGPDAPSWKHGRRVVRDGRGPRDTYG